MSVRGPQAEASARAGAGADTSAQAPTLGHLVVVSAYKPEAMALIHALKLAKSAQLGTLEVFGHDQLRVILSGPGGHASAAAVGLGAGLLGPTARPSFLNLGICGHASLPKGSAFLAHKVQTKRGGSSPLYPAIVDKAAWTCDELWSCDEVETRFGHPGGYDMEGYGFMRAALALTSAEQIRLLKVISDGPGDHAGSTPFKIKSGEVRNLMAAQTQKLLALCQALQELSAQRETREQDPPHLATVRAWARLTQTQSHRLRTLLVRWSARHHSAPPCPPKVWFEGGAQKGLDALEQALLQVPALKEPQS